MLIRKDTNPRLTIFECDRCKTQINSLERKIIYIASYESNPKKKWDFCLKCYKALQKGIANGIKK